eukprot:Colp12_sorted_trinity150504_noHs@31961
MADDEIQEVSSAKCFGGYVKQYKHRSNVLNCDMSFVVYVPPQAETEQVPVLYFLSGLTCTDQNFITKAGAQQAAAELGIMLVCPDTSPRGVPIEGDSESWDFGVGAGFYVDATEEKWKTNYNMYSYVVDELPLLIIKNFSASPDRQSIFGHSMGGHGALICALKNPGLYKSASAFAPISNPINCPWGKKAFSGYLGSDAKAWEEYDATCLVAKYDGPNFNILIDQGTSDKFYIEKQLLPENLIAACKGSSVSAVLRLQEGYDHGYYFIASFVAEHIKFHARYLLA